MQGRSEGASHSVLRKEKKHISGSAQVKVTCGGNVLACFQEVDGKAEALVSERMA
jgi:hypothetical protein